LKNEVLEVPRKKLVEHNALLQAVEMGLPQADIMEKFGIKTSAALETAYFNALVALGKIQDINKKREPKKVDTKVSINSRGSLVIPKKLVDFLELNVSDTFKVTKKGTGLLLKKVEKPPKTILRKGVGHSSADRNSDRMVLRN
jgi:bifunctional DNA-binding transcriptional regulator/antitoxin component of YhaV-PrlF toxin-antitoxin module